MRLLFLTVFLGFLLFLNVEAQSTNPYTTLKDYEIELIRDSRMPVEKLEQITGAGISVEEYFQYPWLKLNISEREWINQRKAGILKGEDYPTQQLRSSQWAVIQNFFIPGLHQFKRKQIIKGILMSTIALGSLSLFSLHRAPGEKGPLAFDYPAYLALLGADLLWSSIDLGVQVNREFDNGAKRFSLPDNNTNELIVFRSLYKQPDSFNDLNQLSPKLKD